MRHFLSYDIIILEMTIVALEVVQLQELDLISYMKKYLFIQVYL